MSNERIDEILQKNGVTGLAMNGDPVKLYDRIIKAMEQIYLSGKWDGTQEVHKTQYNDYNRLRSIVHTQKELIEMYQISVTDWVPDHILRRINNLRNKIKELEQ